MAKERAAYTRAELGEDDDGVFERRAPRVPGGAPKVRPPPRPKAEKVHKPIKVRPPPATKREIRADPERTPDPIVQVMTPEGPVDQLSKAGAAKLERAEQLLQDVFVESLETCQDVLSTFDLDYRLDKNGVPIDPAIPDHWRAELGDDEIALRRRVRIAHAAQLPAKSAPVAIETARAVVQNVVRMHAKQQNIMNVKKLNVAVIVGGTKHDYPSIEMGVSRDDDD